MTSSMIAMVWSLVAFIATMISAVIVANAWKCERVIFIGTIIQVRSYNVKYKMNFFKSLWVHYLGRFRAAPPEKSKPKLLKLSQTFSGKLSSHEKDTQ